MNTVSGPKNSELSGVAGPVLLRLWRPSQEQVVFIVAVVLFLVFATALPGFFSFGNIVGLARSVSILGMLSVGMAIVVISRGIDLSQIATMAIASAWVIQLLSQGVQIGVAVVAGGIAAALFGSINGALVAFVEIPPLFVTLASGTLLFGLGQAIVLRDMLVSVPGDQSALLTIGQGKLFGIPFAVLIFLGLAGLVHIVLSRTSYGRFVYAHGDNLEASRILGINVRLLTAFEYMSSALIAYLAGLLASATVGNMDTQIFYSSKIFDVILVVVLGGISLIGARGSIWSVIVGTALIGILLNGMTLMNVDSDVQSVVKGLVLAFALLVDNVLHPRDEETARQGDL